jgi:hypothetical protein
MSAGILIFSLFCIGQGACQNPPDSPNLPWHSIGEQVVDRELECCAEDAPEHAAAPLQTFVPLSRRIDSLLRSVEIA